MTGFLGSQIVLSSEISGAEAEDYSTITLKNGTVITGYVAGRGGPLTFYSYKPASGDKALVATITGNGTLTLLPSDDGGFKALVHDVSGFQNGTPGIVLFKFDAAGNQIGSAKTIIDVSLNTDSWSSVETSKGYGVTYYDNTSGETGFKAAFFATNGKLLNTFDMDPAITSSDTVRAIELANGNTILSWAEGFTQKTYFQIVKPNGTAVGDKVAINVPTTGGISHFDTEIATNPAGGFAAVWTEPGDPQTLHIQQFTNTGSPKGAEFTFDARVPGARDTLPFGDMKITYLANGAMALAWAGLPTDFGNAYDVFFAVISKTGKVIVGPQLAGQRVSDFQEDVSFTTLRNGDLLLTFRDDGFKNFGYQDSIQAREIIQPDLIWEGNNKANAKVGTDGNDVLLGLGGDDSLDGGKGGDFIKGGTGNDKLFGGKGDDDLQGEGGADQIFGGSGADTLDGAAGSDTLNGGAGDDRMDGDDGNDLVIGGAGADRMNGGEGKDKLNGGGGDDNMDGDAGDDILKGQAGNDFISGGLDNDKLFGGAGGDILHGEGGNDLLKGGGGDDFIFGGDGNDKEFGNAGNDQFHDSLGDDTMNGGGGADVFNFIGVTFGHDVIRDFEFGIDTLDMGQAAIALENANEPAIKMTELANGVRFKIDADNWVLVKGATLSDFQDGDFIIEDPFPIL